MSGAADEGSCRCGSVRFKAAGTPMLTMACHCAGCQKMASSAFSLSSLYSADRFQLSEGEPVRGGLGTGPEHMFCGSCMSWLFTVPDGVEGLVNVRSSMFGNAPAHRPFIDVHLGEGFGWAESGAPRRFDTVPEDSEFPQLMADYAEWDGRVME